MFFYSPKNALLCCCLCCRDRSLSLRWHLWDAGLEAATERGRVSYWKRVILFHWVSPLLPSTISITSTDLRVMMYTIGRRASSEREKSITRLTFVKPAPMPTTSTQSSARWARVAGASPSTCRQIWRENSIWFCGAVCFGSFRGRCSRVMCFPCKPYRRTTPRRTDRHLLKMRTFSNASTAM